MNDNQEFPELSRFYRVNSMKFPELSSTIEHGLKTIPGVPLQNLDFRMHL